MSRGCRSRLVINCIYDSCRVYRPSRGPSKEGYSTSPAEAGIRSIEYDERRKAFYILTGAAANSEKADFKLWEWDGNVSNPTLRAMETFDRKLKPEGITRYSANGKDFTFIVFDTSGYAAMD